MTLEIGIHQNVPAAAYHALPGASASRLRAFHGTTPAHARIAIEKPVEPTVEMILGTLVHERVLEPEKPSSRIAVRPEQWSDWRKDASKEWRAAMQGCGMFVLTPDEFEHIDGMVRAVSSHPVAARLFAGRQSELTCITREPETRLDIRCRLDCVPDGPVLVDLKTTADASERWWRKHAWDSGLHIQASLYPDVWNALARSECAKEAFVFVVVENTPPYAVNLFECSAEFLRRGREDYMRHLRTYAECLRTGIWPAYTSDFKTLDVPAWERNQ